MNKARKRNIPMSNPVIKNRLRRITKELDRYMKIQYEIAIFTYRDSIESYKRQRDGRR